VNWWHSYGLTWTQNTKRFPSASSTSATPAGR